MFFNDIVEPQNLFESGAKGVKFAKDRVLAARQSALLLILAGLLLLILVGVLILLLMLLDTLLVRFQLLFHVDVSAPVGRVQIQTILQ